MSSGAGDARKRPGFMDSFRAALTPPPLPPDDGKPLVRPTSVSIATILALVAGAIFLVAGVLSAVTLESQIETYVSGDYQKALTQCTDKFGGIGSNISAPAGASADDVTQAQQCSQMQPLTDDWYSSVRSSGYIFSGIYVVLGLVALVGGWYLRAGNRWGRLAVVGAVIINVLLTMLLQASTLLTLGAALMLIVAVMLCFIGQGGAYFARVKRRRAG